MIHWSWGIFIPIVLTLIVLIYRNEKNGLYDVGGYYTYLSPFLILIIIIFTLIWGTIFSW